jgi:hypothetical protein
MNCEESLDKETLIRLVLVQGQTISALTRQMPRLVIVDRAST